MLTSLAVNESDAKIQRMRAAALARAEEHRAGLATALKEIALYDQLLALRHGVNSSTVTSEHMQADPRNLAISKGHDKTDPFLKAIRAKGYTLRSLAAAVGEPPSLLSMQRSGLRPMPMERAKRVEKLTGWPATAATWPGGLS